MKRDKAKAEQTNKKGFNMKPLSKKKRIIFSAAWSIVAISAIGVAFYFDQKQQQVCFARPFYTILQRKSTHLCA